MSYKGSMSRRHWDGTKKAVKIQMTLNSDFRDEIEQHAKKQGFDSLQHFTKMLYITILNENLRFNLVSPSNKIAGTFVTDDDIKNYRRSQQYKEYREVRSKLDSWH